MGDDKRLNPRIDFHLDVILRGLKGVKKVKNFSRGGIFVELQHIRMFKAGDLVEIVTRLPLEKKLMTLKGQIAYTTDKGIGIKFVDLWGPNSEAIDKHFEVFKATIPLSNASQ
ncbi:MAG: PilZ domain-containing protein [Deltaproteobacteria bacterium]|nr:PilZ domain-containing protein [Deltaproteobacteria bacterium]